MADSTTEVLTEKSAAAGSSTGRKRGKRQATTPSSADRIKAHKAAEITAARTEVLRAIIATRTQPTGTYSVGHFLTLCRRIGEGKIGVGRLQEVMSEIPTDSGLSDKGNRDVLSDRIAFWISQGGPSVLPKPAKTAKGSGKAPKALKLSPEDAWTQLQQFTDSLDASTVAAFTGADRVAGCQLILDCLSALPAGKPKDAANVPTRRNVMLAFDLAVTGTIAQLAERLAVSFDLAEATVAPKGTVAWDQSIDSASDAELALLEARIVARRQALLSAGSIASGRQVVTAGC